MNKKALAIVLVAFVLAIGAGALMGVGFDRIASPAPRKSPLAEELNLTPPQQDQMKEIWSKVQMTPEKRTANDERRQEMIKERDDAVKALLPPDQRAAYDKVMQDYQAKMDGLSHERQEAFQEAERRTKEILNDAQLKKYEEILQKRAGDRAHGGHDSQHGPTTAHDGTKDKAA